MMTCDEAVSLLRRYRRDAYTYNSSFLTMKDRDTLFVYGVYGRFLVEELIRRIKAGRESPVDVVHDFYTMMDDMLCETDDDHFETLRFARRMEHETGNILRYLREKEKENEHD